MVVGGTRERPQSRIFLSQESTEDKGKETTVTGLSSTVNSGIGVRVGTGELRSSHISVSWSVYIYHQGFL